MLEKHLRMGIIKAKNRTGNERKVTGSIYSIKFYLLNKNNYYSKLIPISRR